MRVWSRDRPFPELSNMKGTVVAELAVTEVSREAIEVAHTGWCIFVLKSSAVMCSDGYLGMMRTEVLFETTDERQIETLFFDLRSQNLEVEGIYVPTF